MISAYKKGLYTRMNSKQKICGTLFLILDKLEIQYHISAIHRQILNYTYPIVFTFCRNIYCVDFEILPLSNEIMIHSLYNSLMIWTCIDIRFLTFETVLPQMSFVFANTYCDTLDTIHDFIPISYRAQCKPQRNIAKL